jgi:phage terminase large subunit-like protein
MLYEQGRVHHVGAFPALEDQMATWEPVTGKPSPDRLDALVWAILKLMVRPVERVRSLPPEAVVIRDGSP